MTDEAPLTTRGKRRTRFDPLRDAPRAENADLSDRDRILLDLERENADLAENGPVAAEKRVLDVVSAVRRQIVALGLAETPEGAMAVTLAEKSEEATGSAAAGRP